MEFLKANGIEDHSFVKEMDYQEVLNSQEIFGDELQMFAKKEMQKEVCTWLAAIFKTEEFRSSLEFTISSIIGCHIIMKCTYRLSMWKNDCLEHSKS